MRILTVTLKICVLLAFTAMASTAQANPIADSQKKYPMLIEGPENSQMGVLIIHDWFGITDFTKESVKRLADNGIRVIAVDLYNGNSAKTHDEAKALQKSLDSEYAQKAIKVALHILKADKRQIAVVGYSAGGKFALNIAAEHSNTINATALIYGGGYETVNDKALEKMGPMLAIYGSEDQWSHKSFLTLQQQINKAQKSIETYVYPKAGHAFAQKLFNSGKHFDPIATKAMRHVLDGFLERQLNPSRVDK